MGRHRPANDHPSARYSRVSGSEAGASPKAAVPRPGPTAAWGTGPQGVGGNDVRVDTCSSQKNKLEPSLVVRLAWMRSVRRSAFQCGSWEEGGRGGTVVSRVNLRTARSRASWARTVAHGLSLRIDHGLVTAVRLASGRSHHPLSRHTTPTIPLKPPSLPPTPTHTHTHTHAHAHAHAHTHTHTHAHSCPPRPPTRPPHPTRTDISWQPRT